MTASATDLDSSVPAMWLYKAGPQKKHAAWIVIREFKSGRAALPSRITNHEPRIEPKIYAFAHGHLIAAAFESSFFPPTHRKCLRLFHSALNKKNERASESLTCARPRSSCKILERIFAGAPDERHGTAVGPGRRRTRCAVDAADRGDQFRPGTAQPD